MGTSGLSEAAQFWDGRSLPRVAEMNTVGPIYYGQPLELTTLDDGKIASGRATH